MDLHTARKGNSVSHRLIFSMNYLCNKHYITGKNQQFSGFFRSKDVGILFQCNKGIPSQGRFYGDESRFQFRTNVLFNLFFWKNENNMVSNIYLPGLFTHKGAIIHKN